MKGIKKLAANAAVAITLAATFETSAFADWRNRNETRRDDRGRAGERDRSYRDNERVTAEGRITTMHRERDGYRVQLDRGRYSYWVPERHVRNRNNWRIGVGVSLGGIFRNGAIYVDVVNDYPYGGGYGRDGRYDDRRGYGRDVVRGIIDRVDYRRGIAVIRDEYSRRLVTVEMRRSGGYRDVGLEDVRRGDYVEISGNWDRGLFEGYRVETVRQGRW